MFIDPVLVPGIGPWFARAYCMPGPEIVDMVTPGDAVTCTPGDIATWIVLVLLASPPVMKGGSCSGGIGQGGGSCRGGIGACGGACNGGNGTIPVWLRAASSRFIMVKDAIACAADLSEAAWFNSN